MTSGVDWSNLIASEAVKALFGAITLVLGAIAALVAFHRQKEYELVKQRYLDEGIDIVAAAFEKGAGVCSHNYARALQVLRLFREDQEKFELKDLDQGFIQLDSSNFNEVAFYRLRIVLGTSIFYDIFQCAMANFESVTSLSTTQVKQAIRRIKLEPDSINVPIDEFANKFAEEIHTQFEGTFKFARASLEINSLGVMFSRLTMSFKQVEQFRERGEVKESLERIRREYPDIARDESN